MTLPHTDSLGSLDRQLIEHYRLDPARTESDEHRDVWRRAKRIGKGSFGAVFLEERVQGSVRETRAVKKIDKTDLYIEKELLALTRLAAARYEAFFAAFKGWYEEQDYIYFAMEYFELGDLAAQLQLRSGPLPEIDACEVVRQICEGLKMMHNDGFTHRDLKPANIFVLQCEPKWRVKIGDFGVSKHVDNGTELRTMVGTRLYMAPEILHYVDEDDSDEEESSTYTNAVDMWSLGVIAFEILCGQRPFRDERDIRAYCRGKLKSLPGKLTATGLDSDTIELTTALLTVVPSGRPRTGRAWLDWKSHTERLQVKQSTVPHRYQPSLQGSAQHLNSSLRALSHEATDKESLTEATSGETTIRARSAPYLDSRNAWAAASARKVEGHSVPVKSIAFSGDGKLLASGTADDTTRVWNTMTGELVHTFPMANHVIHSMAFSRDGRQVASAGGSRTVQIWDMETGASMVRKIKGIFNSVNSVAFSGDGKLLASGSTDETVRIWDMTAEASVQLLQGHTRDVRSVAFSGDSTLLASGSQDKTVRIWDTKKEELVYSLEGHESGVRSVAFSEDGRLVASGPSTNIIWIWDMRLGAPVHKLAGSWWKTFSVAFSGDGQLMVSGSSDNKIRIWDTRTGGLIRTLEEYLGTISGVAFSSDGSLIASGYKDGKLRIWDAMEAAS